MKLIFQLSLFFSLSASASSYYSHSMNEELGISILSEQLALVDGTQFPIGTMMHTWINRSEKENHLCEQYNKDQQQLRLMCIRHDLLLLTDHAAHIKKIDEIEESNLKIYLRKLTLTKGEISFLKINPSLMSRLFNRHHKKVSIPQLGEYETNTNFFKNRRIKMGMPAELDPEVLELLKKAYRRKIFSLGMVTPDQYLLSKYSVGQINLMSGLLLETMNWTDEKVTGEIILDRVGLKKKQIHLRELETQFVKDAQSEMTQEALKQKTDEITSLKKEIELIDTERQINELNEERYQLAIQLASHPSDELNAQILALSDQIDELEIKMEGEIIIVPLNVCDIHRMAMNHLENMIETKRREKGGLSNFDGSIADLLVASYITGETDGESLKALLKIEDYKEIHESLILKTGKFVWTAGRMYLMMNPYTVIPATLVTVVISALQKKKEYEKAMSEKTYLIRQ